jgi:ATP-binding cassette subfamily C (CFTR/MRP) protein 1
MFAAYAIQSKITGTPPLSTAQAFTSLALLSLLSYPVTMLLITGARLFLSKGSIDRIQEFLDAATECEKKDNGLYTDNDDEEPRVQQTTDGNTVLVTVSNIILKPFAEPLDVLDTPISFKLAAGTTTVIIGPVGSGKSALLQTILGELEPAQGYKEVSVACIGYCSQTSWIQNCSIRRNIIGPALYDEAWYKHVLWVCDLEAEIDRMNDGDLTETGSGGSTLSGGQRHRVVWLNFKTDFTLLTSNRHWLELCTQELLCSS